MIRSVAIDLEGEVRRLEPGELPVDLGGSGSDVVVPGLDGDGASIHLGLSRGELFVQPAAGAADVAVWEGRPLESSRWLRSGDVLTIAGTRIFFEQHGDEGRLVIRQRAGDGSPPPVVPARRVGEQGEEEIVIRPVPFEPLRRAVGGRRRRPSAVAAGVVALGVLALAAALWYAVTVRSVRVEIRPAPDQIAFDGALPVPRLGGRFLLRPGRHRMTAGKEGYRRLEHTVVVTPDGEVDLELSLEPLPAQLTLVTAPAVGVAVSVDGRPVGVTPLAAVELDPGAHQLLLAADGYRDHLAAVLVEEPGRAMELSVTLEANLAALTVTSQPAGATIEIDGVVAGVSPLTVEVEEGSRRLLWRLAGHRPASRRIDVVAGEPMSVDERLAVAAGNLSVVSDPAGAALTVDGVYRGLTPLELDLPPALYRLEASKPGHEAVGREVRLGAGASELVELTLPQLMARLSVISRPPNAEVLVDGASRGVTGAEGLVVTLPAGEPREIAVVKEGYETFRSTVTPRPGLDQSIEAVLVTPEESQAARTPPTYDTTQGQRMVLVTGGRFAMGAPRREPGRRLNEVRRDVELVRSFYLAAHEVTNRQFRGFLASHASGGYASANLEIDHHPVVRVTWDEAARYCNWLSAKESLKPVYVARGGRMVAAAGEIGTGYRLATEAEWSWVARGAGGRKYPWGEELPIESGSGNFGGAEAAGILDATLPGYRDDYPGTAPSESLSPDTRGLYHLGGNVAEWMHDVYVERPGTPGAVERDPATGGEGRLHVIRGPSWMTAAVTDLRLSRRDSGADGRPDVGFRIARYAEESKP